MKEEVLQLIEKKLRSHLTPDEEEIFWQRLESDIDFKNTYLFEKQLIENLDEEDWSLSEDFNKKKIEEYVQLFSSEETDQLKETLEKAKLKFRNHKKKPIRRSKSIWYAAAAIVLVIISIFSLRESHMTADELYLAYFDQKEIPSLNQRGNDQNKLISQAHQYFEKKEYQKALPLFEELLKTMESSRATLYLYKGVSQMELGLFAESEKTFNTLIESSQMDAPKGYWFKALLYLKMNDAEKATEILKKIKTESLYNYRKADEILNALN